MNNWKLRSTITGKNGMDFVEVNGHLSSYDDPEDTQVQVVPFGDKFAASLRTSASDDFGPVSNQVPGICNGAFTHTGAASATVSATTLTGEGSSATFTYTFLADGTLSTIVAASGGSNYKVGDKLRITTSASHGSKVIEFRLVDGSNALFQVIRLIHDQGVLPYAVHKVRITESTDHTIQVLDYRSQQVFPRPQDKLLDKYPDAAAAYGLRLLRSAYQGSCIRVQRSSDNALVDIGFKGDSIDLQALQDFVGEYDGRVRTWYDQSGNGNDAEQTNTSMRPNIILGGVLQTVNGKPALDFDGGDDDLVMDHADLYGQTRLDAYMHYQSDDNAYVFFGDPDNAARFSLVPQDGSSLTSLSGSYNPSSLYVNGVKIPAVPGTNTRDELHTALITNGAEHSTGAVVVHEDAGTGSWTSFGISSRPGDALSFAGKVTEVVLYNTDQSANRENIEKDMALHSGAYQVEDAPLLDAYGGAHAAYSLRKLNSDYTGSAVRVRRGSDNAELDLGFKSDGTLDTDAGDAFWDGSNLTVKTWYDQSGNGNDVTQTTGANQPILYNNNGVLQTYGRPYLRFIPNDALPFDNTGLDIGNLSSFAVIKYQDTVGSEVGLGVSGGTANKRWYAPYLLNGNFNYGYGGVVTSVNTTASTAPNLHSMIAGATQNNMKAFLNGSEVGTLSLQTGIDTTNGGIGNLTGAFCMDGYIQEVVVYSSDQSERRLGIERNISNHYEL